MMNEIEVKILEQNHKDFEPKLLELGAKKIFEGELHAIFYDYEDSSIRNSNEVFRIRKEGDKTFITHKKVISRDPVKQMDETEIEVSNFNEGKKLIEALKLKEYGNMKKRRVSYKLNNVKFEFDTYLDKFDFIPEFLEIEAETIEDIYKHAEMLGFSKEDCKPWGGNKLIEHYS